MDSKEAISVIVVRYPGGFSRWLKDLSPWVPWLLTVHFHSKPFVLFVLRFTIGWASLKVTTSQRMTLNFCFSCFHLQSSGVTGMHHAGLVWCWELNLGLELARQALCPLSYTPSTFLLGMPQASLPSVCWSWHLTDI